MVVETDLCRTIMVSGNDSCGVSDELLFSDQGTGSAWKGSPETSLGLPLDNLGGTLNAVEWVGFRECWGPGWPLMTSEASPAQSQSSECQAGL